MCGLLLFAVLLGLPQSNVAGSTRLAEFSSFVFRGLVVRSNASTMSQVPANSRTAVVHVEEVYQAADAIRGVKGMDITLALREPATAGRSYVFFSNIALYGTSLAARETGRLAAARTRESERQLVATAFQEKDDRALRQRIVRAALVVRGRVLRTAPMPRDPSWPVSEHDPEWWTAIVRVDAFAKGQGPSELTVVFPNSKDELWIDAPKFKPEQEGVWILQRDTKEEVPRVYAVRGLTALDPRDFQPSDAWDKVRRLVSRQR
jgi:hypothetical protein